MEPDKLLPLSLPGSRSYKATERGFVTAPNAYGVFENCSRGRIGEDIMSGVLAGAMVGQVRDWVYEKGMKGEARERGEPPR